MLSCEFCEISKNTFSYRTTPVAASEIGNGCPASNANTVALFDDTIELRSKTCLTAVLK